MSACFLRSHVCDVIEFRDDHARMRINDPLASFARFEREKNRVNFVCPANLLQICVVNSDTYRYLTYCHLMSPITRGLLAVETKDSFVLWLEKFKYQKTCL